MSPRVLGGARRQGDRCSLKEMWSLITGAISISPVLSRITWLASHADMSRTTWAPVRKLELQCSFSYMLLLQGCVGCCCGPLAPVTLSVHSQPCLTKQPCLTPRHGPLLGSKRNHTVIQLLCKLQVPLCTRQPGSKAVIPCSPSNSVFSLHCFNCSIDYFYTFNSTTITLSFAGYIVWFLPFLKTLQDLKNNLALYSSPGLMWVKPFL